MPLRKNLTGLGAVSMAIAATCAVAFYAGQIRGGRNAGSLQAPAKNDNPTGNPPSKFLRLTDYQLYLLRQWAEGKFYNEIDEGWVPDAAIDPYQPYQSWQNRTARDLDQAVLAGMLGGAYDRFHGSNLAPQTSSFSRIYHAYAHDGITPGT